MRSVREAIALAAFSARVNLRSRPSRAGLAAFFGIAALGQVLALTRDGGPPDDDRLFGFAFLVGVLLLLRSGLADQRRRGLDEFLRHNFIPAGAQAVGHALALGLQLAGYGLFCLLVATALSGGDLRFAAWYTAVLGLGTALFLPAVLLVDMGADLRIPFVIVPVGLLVAVAVAEPTIGADRLLEALGLRFVRYDAATLLPLLRRVAIAWALGFGGLVLLHAGRHAGRGA